MLNRNEQISIITSFAHLHVHLTTHEFFYKKLIKKYKKISFINIDNLNSSPKKNSKIPIQIIKKMRNYELINPKTNKEFLNHFKNKKTILINAFSRHFINFKIFFLLKKTRSKHIMISNLGSLQGSVTKNAANDSLENFIKIYINNKIIPKILIILGSLNIIPKIDIRFYSNKLVLKRIFSSKITKFLYENKFFYAKKIIEVNSKIYDEILEKKIKKNNKYITLIDQDINYRHVIEENNKIFDKKELAEHYDKLNYFLSFMKKIFKKPIKIAIHPSYNQKIISKHLSKYKVIKYKTFDLINDSELIINFGSSTIAHALLLEKKIITLTSKFVANSEVYSKKLDLFKIDIFSFKGITKKKLLQNLNLKNTKLKNYINNHHVIDKTIPGYKKILNNIDILFKSF